MSRYENGVSFWDVREASEALGRLYHCIVSFEMHLPMRSNTGVCWHVRCVARWYDEKGKACKERGEGGQWPCNGAKTFSGLEYQLLMLLERKIEGEIHDEARAALAQGAMF